MRPFDVLKPPQGWGAGVPLWGVGAYHLRFSLGIQKKIIFFTQHTELALRVGPVGPEHEAGWARAGRGRRRKPDWPSSDRGFNLPVDCSGYAATGNRCGDDQPLAANAGT